uniref:Leucine-rich repeat-containing protein 73 n=1 Tax=Knipowitschia caucasica TaxID=637954 RepID=A0AAV2JR06_KNICA
MGPDQVKSLVEALASDQVQLVSLRGCGLSDQDWTRICGSLIQTQSLLQLNLSLGVVCSTTRTQDLSRVLLRNRSLNTLFLHGNMLSGPGSLVLFRSLAVHPALLSLDLGDCSLSDRELDHVCGLLPPDGAKPGLQELSLSSNPAISSRSWTRLCVAVAHSSRLRVLRLDFNPLGDRVAGMLAVAVASSRTLQTLDLEGTGLTEVSGQAFLDLLLLFPSSLRVLVLTENRISAEVQRRVQELLSERDEPIREEHPQQQPLRARVCQPGGAHTVLLTSGLGDNLLDETEM